MANKDIVKGTDGYWQNALHAPDYAKWGNKFDGYRSYNEWVLFYYFAVQGYDLRFDYKGKTYYFLSEQDYVALTDSSFSEDIRKWDSANEMFETFEIDGKKLIDIVNKLKNVEAV